MTCGCSHVFVVLWNISLCILLAESALHVNRWRDKNLICSLRRKPTDLVMPSLIHSWCQHQTSVHWWMWIGVSTNTLHLYSPTASVFKTLYSLSHAVWESSSWAAVMGPSTGCHKPVGSSHLGELPSEFLRNVAHFPYENSASYH